MRPKRDVHLLTCADDHVPARYAKSSSETAAVDSATPAVATEIVSDAVAGDTPISAAIAGSTPCGEYSCANVATPAKKRAMRMRR